MNKVNWLFDRLRARKVAWLTPFVVYAFLTIDIQWLLLGFLAYMIGKSIFIATFHEYVIHKWIRPKHKLIEILGWYLSAVWEWVGPKDKAIFHYLHHQFHRTDNDPTHTKLALTDNWLLYHLDLTPHSTHESLPKIPFEEIDRTDVYEWFTKHWRPVVYATLILWLVLLPFWTFLAFLLWPIWIWTIAYRFIDWHYHKRQRSDPNWLVFLLGSHAWHNYHHAQSDYGKGKDIKEVYYGPDPWKKFNIDYYIHKLLYKPYHSE